MLGGIRFGLAALTCGVLVGCHAEPVGLSGNADDAAGDTASDTASDGTAPADTRLVDSRSSDAIDADSDSADSSDSRDLGAADTADTRPPPIDGGSCGTLVGGPTMVNVGSFCIDSTEVTNAQYNVFLAAGFPLQSVSSDPISCTENATYGLPFAESAGLDKPRVNIDWCDAYAFCSWAGKRLCGKIGGGANDPGDYALASKSEWMAACQSGSPTAPYPYGATFDAAACNVNGSGTTDVKSHPGCRGPTAPFDGVFDLSGNVEEWENSCDGTTSKGDQCLLRGGGFLADSTFSRCDNNWMRTRESADPDRGFRCCK